MVSEIVRRPVHRRGAASGRHRPTLETTAALGMLADPCTGREVWDALDHKVGKAG
jgi:hypothetical protein